MSGLALAIEFLTVLPVRRTHANKAVAAEPPDMARALPWFPLVGALLGLALVGLDSALSFIFPLGIRAVALLAFDALSRECCTWMASWTAAMRCWAHVRSSGGWRFCAIAVSARMARLVARLLLLAKYAALTALVSGPVRVLALLAAPILGRWGMMYAVTRYPYARAAGAGAPFRNRGVRQLFLASMALLLLLAASALIVGSCGSGISETLLLAVLLLVAALLVLLGWLAWASRRLGGGLTGDTYGAACVLVELAVLVLAPPLAELALRIVGS